MHTVWSTGAESWAFGSGDSAWLSCNRGDLELHEDAYTPGPGELCHVPRARSSTGTGRDVYVVTALDGDTMSYVAASALDAEPYTLTLERARTRNDAGADVR